MIIAVKMVYKHYAYLNISFMSSILRLLLSRNIVTLGEPGVE